MYVSADLQGMMMKDGGMARSHAAAAVSRATVVDRDSFRDGMSRLAAAVNIVTSMDGDRPCGFTASAVLSVTDAPPTLLVCINRESQSYPSVRRSGIVCVNTLGARHEALSKLFAGGVKDMDARFAAAEWTYGITGAPILSDAVVAFDCRVNDVVSVGTHGVFLCSVEAMHRGEEQDGLVYFNRKFRGLDLT
jgi:flavin reductase